jgi:thiamine pyrophosphokinase
MSAIIVRSDGPILLVGAGALDTSDLSLIANYGESLVAADGGAAACLAAGRMPDAVIGDMDSLDAGQAAAVPEARVHRIAEQDSTDFDKCLRSVAAPLVVAVGFAGPRLDHTLAVFNALVRHGSRRVVVAAPEEIAFHLPRSLSLDLTPGTRVSLFPMRAVAGRSEGLRWPIDGLGFAPDGRIGTSNEATGPVRIETDGPGMLAITPRAALERVASALTHG